MPIWFLISSATLALPAALLALRDLVHRPRGEVFVYVLYLSEPGRIAPTRRGDHQPPPSLKVRWRETLMPAPVKTEEVFLQWLEADRPVQFVSGGEGWIGETLLALLAGCDERLPEPYCSALSMASDTTYGEAARALRAARDWLPAPSDPSRLRPVSMAVDDNRATVRLSRRAVARMAEGAPLYLGRGQASRLWMSRELVVRVER